MLETILTILVAIVVLTFMIVRQLRARRIKFPNILILPAILVWITYTNIVAEMGKEHADIALLLGLFVLGLIPGLALGGYRSLLYSLRIDATSETVLAQRAGLFSIAIWFILLAAKIAASVLTYTTPGGTTLTIFLLITAIHGLFIGNVIGENLGLWLRANNYQSTHVHSQVIK
ncbi:hypothetical protein [Ktedonospora formicarum]|uniref:DUF1453 domain-containing protein n=1 Tax=Ktedonospora formicarum TaxID=2778364 RepID=A0A8J3I0Y9_9CHLR|nr:hypothetical protein [Ktedonospora formicarum]GHO44227.1 hypothetical protein KSX_23900 [Ktedonospora formicarum]